MGMGTEGTGYRFNEGNVMTTHKQGEFCWPELSTTDSAAAKAFYSKLLGWTFDDTTCLVRGKRVGALCQQKPEQLAGGPVWASYIAVDSADATTARAVRNGATVMVEPFDVMDAGRMAVLVDPTGAVFWIWQANQHTGVELTREGGAMCWNELYTTDAATAGRFYGETLGWSLEPIDMGPMGLYTLFTVPGKEGNIGGMMPIGPHMKGVPSHWLVYFAVASCDASTKLAEELGATVQLPPTDIPNIGRFSIVRDPQGAALSLYENKH
jgi:uncharacterized protein